LHVFVTRDLPGSALDRLRARHTVDVWTAPLPPSPGELAQRARQAEGLLTLLTDRVDAPLLRACPGVRAISNYAVGFENVDVAAATARRIPVGHTPDVLTRATAQLAITLILALLRRVHEADRYVRDGRWLTWEPAGHLGAAFGETTLGLVGYGRIGQEVGHMATALGMRVLHTDPVAGGLTLGQVLHEADVISLHAQLTPETRKLINRRSLSAMRPGAFLVNVARGDMVDTDALTDALRTGHLAGAALDVTCPEPLPPDHEMLRFDNVIVTPHIASATATARAGMADLAVDNLIAALAGHPMPHCANPQVYGQSSPT
jgi:glyoxylate reductase